MQVHEVALEIERYLLVQGGQSNDALELIVSDVAGRIFIEQMKGRLVDRVRLTEQRFERLKFGERNQPVRIAELDLESIEKASHEKQHSPISGCVQNAADQLGSVDVDLLAFAVAQIVEYEVLRSHKLFAITFDLRIFIEYFSEFVRVCSFDMLSILWVENKPG